MSERRIRMTDADVAVAHRFLHVIGHALWSAGDMELSAYAVLVCVLESADAPLVKELAASVDVGAPMNRVLELLEEEELLERRRSLRDRRAFCVKVTDKGRARIALADECVARMVVDVSPRFSETTFSQFTAGMYAYANSMAPKVLPRTFIPGSMLAVLSGLRGILVGAAAMYGLTSLQASMLAGMACAESSCTSEYLSPEDGSFSAVAEVQLLDLERKNLVQFQQGYWELTERGARRLADVKGRLSQRVSALLAGHSDAQFDALCSVLRLGRYLFS